MSLFPNLSALIDAPLSPDLVQKIVCKAQGVPLKVVCWIEVCQHRARPERPERPHAVVRTSFNSDEVIETVIERPPVDLLSMFATLSLIDGAIRAFARHMTDSVERVFKTEMQERGWPDTAVERFDPPSSSIYAPRYGHSPYPIDDMHTWGQDVRVDGTRVYGAIDELKDNLIEKMRVALAHSLKTDQQRFEDLYREALAAEPDERTAAPMCCWATSADGGEYSLDRGERWRKSYTFETTLRVSQAGDLGRYVMLRQWDP